MKEIVEDLLKLIYAYQDMHNRLGIIGEQSPSVLRAEEWVAAQHRVQADKCLSCDHGIEYLGSVSAAVCRSTAGWRR